jgi:hypothetical protein
MKGKGKMSRKPWKWALAAARTTALCVLFSVVSAFGALAVEGWNLGEDGEWSYLDAADRPVTDTWRSSRGYWYYLGPDGRMLKSTLLDKGASRYWLDGDGRMAAGGWAYVPGDAIPDGSEGQEGWYYFGGDGKAYTSKGGKKKLIGDKYYIFDADGQLQTGWLDGDGSPVEGEDPFVEAVYFAGPDGALYTNAWLRYSDVEEGVGGSDLYSVTAARSYTEYEEMWLYFDESSKKVHALPTAGSFKQRVIDGSTYGFDENGIMFASWTSVATVSHAQQADPTSDVSAKYFSGYDDGVLFKNSWFWMYPSESQDAQEYHDMEASWWYADGSGRVVRDRIRLINGRRYAFDGLGRMRTGFVYFDGRSDFVASYDVDMWESADFKGLGSRWIYGSDLSDLYLFSPDELNDGSMQTGTDIMVGLKDGYFYFGFAENGKAFGNKNTLEKHGSKYYINGLRLDADPDFGYGVVESERDGAPYYQVVDVNGKVIEGERKIVTDRQGGYYIILKNQFVQYVTDAYKPKWLSASSSPTGVAGYFHYDKDNKADHYARGAISTVPNISDLPREVQVYIP